MHISVKRVSRLASLSVAVLIGGGLTTARPAAAQDLNGQQVTVDYLFPSTGNLYENDGNGIVTPAGITFTSFGFVNTTAKPSEVDITFNGGAHFTNSSFNGPHLYEIGALPVSITGVTVDGATNVFGFDSSRVTFDSNGVYANLQGLSVDSGKTVRLNLSFGPSSVTPEGSSLAMMGLGLLPLAYGFRRKLRKA